jgi:adenosylcobinamide-phosphate synthase
MGGLSIWSVIPLAFALDLLFGDPARFPHPVRWMGAAITRLEPRFRRLAASPALGGTLFAVFLTAGTWALTAAATVLVRRADAGLAVAFEAVLVYYCISARSLYDAADEIYRLLATDRISEARTKVAWIVGRDVRGYQGPDIARAAVETVAENFVDGVLSPLFFAACGGAPLAMAFKMVSTLDSMVGYKNEAYRKFGMASARLDDAFNFIPARLSVALIALCAQILAGSGRRALATAWAEGANHPSPNAGRPEAAFAGALAVKLNGPNIYGGVRVEKPFIGVRFGAVRIADIKKACDLMVLSSLAGLALATGVALFF